MRLLVGSIAVCVAIIGCGTQVDDSRPESPGSVKQALGTLSRTPWQMHQGGLEVGADSLGLVQFTCAPTVHGDVCEYDDATVPPAQDAAWGPAPNGEEIGLDMFCGESRVCQAPVTCMAWGDFTYFQTFVNVPADMVVTEFSIAFAGMDDGSRVSIYNSQYPAGIVVPGSYVFLGGSGTTNLGSFVVAGEENRVVVTQVDDCCCENHLQSAKVVLNGEVIDTGCHGPADCDDQNACTTDECNADGSCNNSALSCDDGNACTADACDAIAGCSNVNQCPSCDAAAATVTTIWPPDHALVSVGVQGVVDPQGQSTTIRIDGVTQDEPTNTVGDGNFCPDAAGLATNVALLRAERSGTPKVPGNGRVYHIAFTATDPDGFSCSGEVTSCVPHDQGRRSTCVDEGELYDSLVCQ